MPDSMNFEEWLAKAQNDLLAAEAILAYYEEPPTDTVCYHAHQVGEKCFKACVAIDPSFEEFRETARNLNRYYIDAKYPPGVPYWYSKDEAKIAVDQAREILAFTRKKLITTQSDETKQ
jgi:HEPN domain-containing protein